jgi:hypothetical protein
MVTLVEKTHPFASLTWTLCIPAAIPEYDVAAVKAEASTEKLYGAVPPVTPPSVMVPLLSPQLELAAVALMAVGPLTLIMMTLVEKIQLLASLTWILCGPAASPE